MPYTVAVRELCEFTAKQGDLDLRFTPAPTAQEGIAGHALVYERRGPDYRREVTLSGEYGDLRVRGRADGFDPGRRRLEEIKTFRGSLDRQRPTHRRLHWAQAKVYAWLQCQAEDLPDIEVALVYLELGSQEETILTERCTAEDLRVHFESLCERFLAWAVLELDHRERRDAALQALRFPFGDFRVGQRPLAEAVYRAATSGRCLLAQAPTGIGKTMGTIFPLLKAAPGQRLDKVFFLAAKTSGRQTALDAIERLAPAMPLRVLELVARDKVCEHPDKACNGESCPLAKGFYDRLPAARAAAVRIGHDDKAGASASASGSDHERGSIALTRAAVREVALAHEVCPYYLSQELARWADVVVGDYNYYFDHGAFLHGLTQVNQWRIGLLVDEAHNLVERGRKMYSATLSPERLFQARHSSGASASPLVRKALDKVRRSWRAIDKAQVEPYAAYEAFPESLLSALQHGIGVIAEHLAAHPDDIDEALLDFHFEAMHVARAVESFGPHSLVDVQKPASVNGKAAPSIICIRNIVPAPFLKPRLAAAHTSTLFSATLQPQAFHADLLGLPENHASVEVPSPFDASQLQVHVASHISTRYQHRRASVQPIADLIAAQYGRAPGNYLAFLSSYDYLEQVAALLAERHPEVPQWRQSRRMSEGEQRQFLDRFTVDGRGVGFAVLGGAFAEGVDLPGRRLIGAFLSTLGLPQVNAVNEQIRARMETLFGAGYDYTYLYPGLQKVVQAAGRVIRTTEDRGVVHLIDDRFARAEVQRLLPAWWAPPPA